MAIGVTAAAIADDNSARLYYLPGTATERTPLSTLFPDYPSIARRDRIEGEATVCFNIDRNGKVKRAKVTESTHRIFRNPSLRAAKKSTFEALKPGEVPTSQKTCRIFRYRLDPVVAELLEN